MKKERNVSIENIFEALSDNKALVLFNTIAITTDVDNGGSNSQIQIRKLGLTTRQYYSRITRLTETGLIRRQCGRYSLTLLGKMIYDIHITASRVLSYHWKLKAIESIQMSNPVGVPEEEFSKLVDALIDDNKIKNMVAKAIYPQLTNNEKYPRQQQQQEEPQSIKVQASTIRHLHGEV